MSPRQGLMSRNEPFRKISRPQLNRKLWGTDWLVSQRCSEAVARGTTNTSMWKRCTGATPVFHITGAQMRQTSICHLPIANTRCPNGHISELKLVLNLPRSVHARTYTDTHTNNFELYLSGTLNLHRFLTWSIWLPSPSLSLYGRMTPSSWMKRGGRRDSISCDVSAALQWRRDTADLRHQRHGNVRRGVSTMNCSHTHKLEHTSWFPGRYCWPCQWCLR